MSNKVELPIEFRAQPREYFRIWILNYVLTLVTLGIYSPWAKVKNRKYIFQNSYLSNYNFDYMGDPTRILFGRLILAALVLIHCAAQGSTVLWLLSFLIFLGVFPWLLTRAMIFNMASSVFRTNHFSFRKDYRDAYQVYIKAALITIFTLGFGFPYAMYLHHQYRVENSRIGHVSFAFTSKDSTPFFNTYLVGLLIYIISVFIFAATIYSSLEDVRNASQLDPEKARQSVVLALPILFLGFTTAIAYIKAKTQVFLWKHTTLPGITFQSTMEAGPLLKLYLQAGLASFFTLGVAYPFFAIRILKYKLENLKVMTIPEMVEQLSRAPRRPEGYATDAAPTRWDIQLGL